MKNYFTHFPRIVYNGQNIPDYSKRVAFLASQLTDPLIFYSIPVTTPGRADIVSANVYGSDEYEWLIYFANLMYDPNDFVQDDRAIERGLIQTYGSLAIAMAYVLYYQTNEEDDKTVLTQQQYDSLPTSERIYYTRNGEVYTRAMLNWRRNTNMYGTVNVTSTAAFRLNEPVTIQTNPRILASVSHKYANRIVLKHIRPSLVPCNGAQIIGQQSRASATCTSNIHDLIINIPGNELRYWKAISAYDEAMLNNEKKRTIRLLRPELITPLINNMRVLLSSRQRRK